MTLVQLKAHYPILEEGEPSECSSCGQPHPSCEVITDEGERILFISNCSGDMEEEAD